MTYSLPRIKAVTTAVGIQPTNMSASTDNDSTWKWKGRMLRVRTNAQGQICHIGYRLFPRGIMEAYPCPAVLHFLERYALELDLKTEGKSADEQMRIDGVELLCGRLTQLADINDETPVSIDNVKRKTYEVTWSTTQGDVTISFPADCQLLLGGNAIELEENLLTSLPLQEEYPDSLLLLPWSKIETDSAQTEEIFDYGTYLSPLIKSSIHIAHEDSTELLVCKRERLSVSVFNIMLTGISQAPINVNLTLDVYGYKEKNINITLRQLISFCHSECSKVYMGIKEMNEQLLTGTLFIYNEALGYNHVIPFSFPTCIIKGENATVQARMYAYIPLQNVTDKFFDSKNYIEYDE